MNRDGFFSVNDACHAERKASGIQDVCLTKPILMIVPSTNYGLMAKARTSPIYDDFERGTCSCPYSMPTCCAI